MEDILRYMPILIAAIGMVVWLVTVKNTGAAVADRMAAAEDKLSKHSQTITDLTSTIVRIETKIDLILSGSLALPCIYKDKGSDSCKKT
jgi:hypothetical protein